MASRSEPVVRDAEQDDVAAICRFGEAHIRPHYAPLIGAEAADEQVRRWWNETHVGAVWPSVTSSPHQAATRSR
jgi:hypothetical protein